MWDQTDSVESSGAVRSVPVTGTSIQYPGYLQCHDDLGEFEITEVSQKHNNLAGVSARILCALIDVPPVNRNDVLESLLFAQLVASARVSAFENPKQWYQEFGLALSKLFWVTIDGPLEFHEASLPSTNISVSQIVLDFLKAVKGAEAAARLIETVKKLPPNDRLPTIFNRGSTSIFQLSTVKPVGRNVALVGGVFHADSNITVGQVLFAELNSNNAHFFQGHSTLIRSYATVEDSDELCDSLLIGNLQGNEYELPVYLDCGKQFSSFVVDSLQKLVVLVETSYDSPTLVQFDFRSTEDGKPHPCARTPIIAVQLDASSSEVEVAGTCIEVQTQIAKNLLIAGCYWPKDGDIYEIVIFDWISGVLLGRIHSRGTITASFVLLDKDYLAVSSATSESLSKHPDMIALQVYHIPPIALSSRDKDGRFETSSHAPLAPTLILEFPRVRDPFTIGWESAMSAGLGVGRISFDGLITCVCSRVTTLDVKLSLSHPYQYTEGLDPQETDIPGYRIYISTCHIFELLDRQGAGPVRMNWNEWGPRATRWFDEQHGMSPIVGSQCIQWTSAGSRYQKLSSVEFNPYSIEAY